MTAVSFRNSIGKGAVFEDSNTRETWDLFGEYKNIIQREFHKSTGVGDVLCWQAIKLVSLLIPVL